MEREKNRRKKRGSTVPTGPPNSSPPEKAVKHSYPTSRDRAVPPLSPHDCLLDTEA